MCSGKALQRRPAHSLAVAREGADIAALNLCSSEMLLQKHGEVGRICAVSFPYKSLFSSHRQQDCLEFMCKAELQNQELDGILSASDTTWDATRENIFRSWEK